MLSVSTAWNYHPDKDVRRMLEEIKDLGVEAIELGYRLTKNQLEEAVRVLPELGLKVSSIHNFCPIPSDGPSDRHPSNYYRLSAQDEQERCKAVLWTKICVDSACRVGARVVVIHAGMIEMDDDPSIELLRLGKQGCSHLSEIQDALKRVVEARAHARGPFIEAARRSLREVMPYAREKHVIIGLETRYYPTEIPNCEEIGEFLEEFGKQGMMYWHDVGHAAVNERLGIIPHREFLDRYQDRLIGFHIHGVQGIKDHFAPFTGDFDLNSVLPYMQDKHIKVIESHAGATVKQLKQAVRQLTPRERA